MNKIYDKHGRPIEIGDVLKIYHFKDRRRKYWMYKQVVKIENNNLYEISHLQPHEHRQCFWMIADNTIHPEIEIVQGYGVDGQDYFLDRKRIKT